MVAERATRLASMPLSGTRLAHACPSCPRAGAGSLDGVNVPPDPSICLTPLTRAQLEAVAKAREERRDLALQPETCVKKLEGGEINWRPTESYCAFLHRVRQLPCHGVTLCRS